MHRTTILAAVTAVSAGALSASALTTAATAVTAAPKAHAARAYTVSAASSRGHTIIVDRNGLALYMFTRDRGAHNSCVHVSGCSSVWPTFTTTTRPTAGPGVKASLLGTIRVGSRLQVTYAGHPLYEYSEKSFPGFVSYIGTNEFGGVWDALSPSGKTVR